MKKMGAYFDFLDYTLLHDIDDVQKMYAKASDICNLFQYHKKINLVKIYSFQEFEKILSMKIPYWVIGTGYYNNVLILDKSKWQQNNNMTVDSLILHEMVHIVLQQSCNIDLPIWLNEGLAVVLSGQRITYDKERILSHLYEKDIYTMEYEDELLYNCSGFAVSAIINNYGLHKIVEELKSFNSIETNQYWDKDVLYRIIEEFNY